MFHNPGADGRNEIQVHLKQCSFRSSSAHKKALAVLLKKDNVRSNLRDAMVLQPDDFGHADATGGNVNNTEEGDHFQDFVVKALRRKHRVLLRRTPKVDAARVAETITSNLIKKTFTSSN